MITTLQGELQIDHSRGVIYFHQHSEDAVPTVLRICQLPKPIPQVQDRMLDITHMHGCDWKGE